MLIGSNKLIDISMDPSESKPQTIPFTQKRYLSFVWLYDNGIMNCGGYAETSCQYWPLGASAAENAPPLPHAFMQGSSVPLGFGSLWIGGGRPDSGGGQFIRQHFMHTEKGFTRLTPDMPVDLICFCAINLGGNRQAAT